MNSTWTQTYESICLSMQIIQISTNLQRFSSHRAAWASPKESCVLRFGESAKIFWISFLPFSELLRRKAMKWLNQFKSVNVVPTLTPANTKCLRIELYFLCCPTYEIYFYRQRETQVGTLSMQSCLFFLVKVQNDDNNVIIAYNKLPF